MVPADDGSVDPVRPAPSGRTGGGWEARLEASGSRLRAVRRQLTLLSAVSPRLAARVAMRLFRTVKRHRVPERELAWVASAEPFELGPKKGRLRGLVWGDGPPVLLLHGWEGRASQMGAIGMELAARGLRAVSLEAPGHGDQKPAISSLRQFSTALSELVAVQGPFHGFVGHSFGCAGMSFSLLSGASSVEDLGSRLVFVSPPYDLNDFFEVLFSLLRLREDVARRFVRGMEKGIAMPWGRASRCVALAARDVPLLIVHDEGDHDTPMAGAEAVAAAWPRSELMRTSGLGHRRILRDETVFRRIGDFLSAPLGGGAVG